ncbi:MAG: transcriptional regulator [Rhodovulum sulfidophilum]|uniref:Transcriptional regulator n=1 Tax=Rhodovulum sulfidophilum TaxID=35806 RepID=A0A2W5N635_RHOSU|nr:MAG: transcriptional regulator [Rhodovulum sulfidophilum]
MYTPPAFAVEDPEEIRGIVRAARLATLVTAGPEGLMATPLPLFLEETGEGFGVLHGHLARANRQWSTPVAGEALAIFAGSDAYVTPAWYATKAETGKVVPTWNYEAVHLHGRPEFFTDPDRLLESVSRLTALREAGRAEPWAVGDAPGSFVRSQLKGIVGVRMPVSRVEAKRKMSQNRNAADRGGVAEGLAASPREADRHVAALIPR